MEGSGQKRRRAFHFLVVALPILAALYLLFYRQHAPGSAMDRVLSDYLRGVAWTAALLVRPLEPSVTVDGTRLGGRFALEIVVDCAALDVQAIFAAAVVAFPVPWRRRAAGVAAGLALIAAFNVLRIACLYLVGARAPGWFHVLHEEVFQIAIVLGACLMFGAWVFWARPVVRREPGLGMA